MLDFENSAFDEIGEIYGGFPLRENFMEIGNAALKEFGVEAEYEDGIIRIPYVCREYFNEEDLEWFEENEFDLDEVRKSRLYAVALIRVEDPKIGVTGADLDCWADGEAENDDAEIIEDHMSSEEWDQAEKLIEAFLNVAVNAD